MYKIGLMGSPGSGKTTAAAGVFYQCKRHGIQTELVQEFVREEINRGWIMTSVAEQLRLQMKQREREDIIPSDIEVMITDSPTLLQYVYGLRFSNNVKEDLLNLSILYEEYLRDSNRYDKIYYLNNPRSEIIFDGTRKENVQECAEIGDQLKTIMLLHHIPFTEITGDDSAVEIIFEDICQSR